MIFKNREMKNENEPDPALGRRAFLTVSLKKSDLYNLTDFFIFEKHNMHEFSIIETSDGNSR
jgi:hypothetical protein